MAWLTVKLVDEADLVETVARDGSVSASTSRTFYCESDVAVSSDELLGATLLGVTVPVRLESFSVGRPNCRVRKRTAQKATSHRGLVICDYEDSTDGSTLSQLPSRAARISSRPESFTEGYAIDAENTKVVNTAGEVFDQLPERQAAIKGYVIKKYVSATVKGQIKAAWNTNNNAGITIDGDTWAADEGWLADYSFDPVDGSTLWDATVVIKCKTGGWKDTPLNVGFREIKVNQFDGIAKAHVIKKEWDEDEGRNVACAKPWPLDAAGKAKSAVAGSAPLADSLVFYPYKQNAWTGVPLS